MICFFNKLSVVGLNEIYNIYGPCLFWIVICFKGNMYIFLFYFPNIMYVLPSINMYCKQGKYMRTKKLRNLFKLINLNII